MALVSATNTATPSLQSVLSKNRLAQARQQATQAEVNAEDLRARANEAEQDAAQSQGRVQALSRQQQQSDPTYRQKTSRSEGGFSPATQEVLVTAYAASAANRLASNSTLRTDVQASPVTNSQGDLTGRIVDLQA
jgi:Tfp pilus assembly major pilin PilA